MSGKTDVEIARKLGMTVMQWHELLGRMERLTALELNQVAMQLINRSVMQLEKGGNT